MFTDAFFKTHQGYYAVEDVWLKALLRLHVASNYASDHQFKVESAVALQGSNVYKTTKLKQKAVEENLLGNTTLSPSAFFALTALYRVDVAVVLGRACFSTGNPSYYLDARGTLKPMPSARFDDLLQVPFPGKPLNALSYYSAKDLDAMSEKIRYEKGCKTYMYNGIAAYLHDKLTVFKPV